MTAHCSSPLHRRPSRRGPLRPAPARRLQRGVAERGLVVAAGLVAAVALQLAGPRLQCRLADLVGTPAPVPVMTPAAMPSCGSPSGANSMHPCKVATAAFGFAPET